MSNLGMYQVLTTVAKRVGGPIPLIGIVACSGIALGVSGTVLYYKLSESSERSVEPSSNYTVRIRKIHS